MPFTPPPRHKDLFKDVEIRLPGSYGDTIDTLPYYIRGDETTKPILAAHTALASAELKRLSARGDAVKEFTREYWRMIPAIDDVVGRIYKALEVDAIIDETVIMLSSDNGMMLGEHGLLRKGVAYDPSIHVPLLIRYPGVIPPGMKISRQVLNLDIPPTVLQIGKVPMAPQMSGRNLLELVENPQAKWREDWLYIERARLDRGAIRPSLMAVRSSEWKYIRYTERKIEEELFNLTDDPDERSNLAHDDKHSAALKKMRQRMDSLMSQNHVPAAWGEAY